MTKIVCVIPARLKSTRLPNKPLINICGKTMIRRTYERAMLALSPKDIYVATDSVKIMDECRRFTENVFLTSEQCLTGTDRIAEFSKIVDADVYLNLQGDEPIMPTYNILKMWQIAMEEPNTIHNGYARILDDEQYNSRTVPKVVFSKSKKLLYMSRAGIPAGKTENFQFAYKQICIYAFPKEALLEFSKFESKSKNETVEDIEILRFIENDFVIQMHEMSPKTIAVDTPEELAAVRILIKRQKLNIDEYEI